MDPIQVRHDDGVAIVTFADAERMNSFDPALLRHLRMTFRDLMEDDGVRAMVLTGTGRAFSAGADVAQFQKGIENGEITEWILAATEHLHPLMVELHQCHKPLVAAVNGVAAGGGLGLALAADVRIGSPDARFAAGYFGIGASPDGGSTWFLPRLIGAQATRRFFFENQIVGAEQALDMGLMDEMVDADGLVARATDVARQWGTWAKHSRESTKRLLDAAHSNDLEAHLDLERGLIAAAGSTHDFREGVRAFLGKQRPAFR